MIQLSHPGSMEGTENISIVPGDGLVLADEETSTARPVLLLLPAVRTVVGLLGQDGTQEGENHQVLHTQSGPDKIPQLDIYFLLENLYFIREPAIEIIEDKICTII